MDNIRWYQEIIHFTKNILPRILPDDSVCALRQMLEPTKTTIMYGHNFIVVRICNSCTFEDLPYEVSKVFLIFDMWLLANFDYLMDVSKYVIIIKHDLDVNVKIMLHNMSCYHGTLYLW